MKYLFLSAFSLFCCSFAFGQTELNDFRFSRKNSVQLEAGGHGFFYSLNYERFWLNENKWKASTQVGASYYTPKSGVIPLWLPITANVMYSLKQHHVELGLGRTVTLENMGIGEQKIYWSGFWVGRLGYRYQKPDGKWLIRASFSPILEDFVMNPRFKGSFLSSIYIHPLPALAFGYCFGTKKAK